MRSAICPGSYDPATNGHLDIIERASALFDDVVVPVMINKSKRTLFSVEERMDMLRDITTELSNVRVDSWQGLLVDYCRQHAGAVIVKGLRSVSDFDYELQMAQMNRELSGVETLLMANSPAVGFLSSSLVREIATYGGNIENLVPPIIAARVTNKIARRATP